MQGDNSTETKPFISVCTSIPADGASSETSRFPRLTGFHQDCCNVSHPKRKSIAE